MGTVGARDEDGDVDLVAQLGQIAEVSERPPALRQQLDHDRLAWDRSRMNQPWHYGARSRQRGREMNLGRKEDEVGHARAMRSNQDVALGVHQLHLLCEAHVLQLNCLKLACINVKRGVRRSYVSFIQHVETGTYLARE